MPTFIDLFSGSGGLTLGFEQAAFANVFSVDFDQTFNKTYSRNFPSHTLIKKNITELTTEEIRTLIKKQKIDVVVGGPPCQGFSMAGSIGRKFVDDPRNYLFKEFARVVDAVSPDFFIMENVARLYTHNQGKTRAEILETFKKIGYNVKVKVINTADYGVPQQRRRTIFIGTKLDVNIIFPKPLGSKPVSVKDAIDDLPRLKSGENSCIPNHVAMNHTDQMLHKMSFVTDGGTRNDIPKAIRPTSGDIRKYIRYSSAEPSVCITGDMRKVFHYRDNRALTVRELARLQTYPDNFIFEGSVISQQQQVGNSVPPLLGYHLAKNIRHMMSTGSVHDK